MLKRPSFISAHSYGCAHQGVYFLSSTGVILILPVFALFACPNLPTENIGGFLASLFGGMMLLAFFALEFPNLYPGIRIYEEGLKVQVFFFGWYFVPWDDVLDWHASFLPSFSGNTSIMLVRRLTPAHYLIGWTYAFRNKPGFLISSRISGYRELRQVIREKMRELGEGM